MFCENCGKEIKDENKFCPYCGAACPTAELEEKAADVIEQADEELEEAAEAEVTEVPETEAEENAEVTEVAADPEETVEASEVVETAETAEGSNRNIRIRSGIGRGKNGSGICRNRGACG